MAPVSGTSCHANLGADSYGTRFRICPRVR